MISLSLYHDLDYSGETFGSQILEVVNWIAMIISDVLLSFSLASH